MKKSAIFKVLLLLVLGNILVFLFSRDKGFSVVFTTKDYLLEMLTVLPPILILVGLFEVWVPKKFIEAAMGRKSGIKGILFSFLVGTAAMGPLYVAFPIGLSLLKKKASLFHVAIYLGAWASIKIPMILFEIQFLGSRFAFLRLALTIPSIIAIGWILNSILKRSQTYEAA